MFIELDNGNTINTEYIVILNKNEAIMVNNWLETLTPKDEDRIKRIVHVSKPRVTDSN